MLNKKVLRSLITLMLCLIMASGAPLTILAETTDEIVSVQEADAAPQSEEDLQVTEETEEPVEDPLPQSEGTGATEPETETFTEPLPTPVSEPETELVSEPSVKQADTDVMMSGTAYTSQDNSGKADPGPGEAGYKVPDDMADAEKYLEEGYDAGLCWAATAANMLWEGYYGRVAVNPLTNKNFESEDEIFDYFRKCFTDDAREPQEAIRYFFEGNYEGPEGLAQLKGDAPKGALVPWLSGVPEGYYESYEQNNDNNILSFLADMTDKAVAGWIRWWNTGENKFDPGAHWLTIVGYEMDEGRYTGIWLVDSDNDTVLRDGQQPPAGRTDEQKAELAAKQPNTRTYYPLSWHLIDQMYYWVIDGYLGEDETVTRAVLAAVDYLMKLPQNGGGPDEDDDSKDQPSAVNSDDPSSSEKAAVLSGVPGETAVMATVYDSVKTMMMEKGLVCYAPMGNVYDPASAKGHSLIIRASFTTLVNVYVNGVRMSGNGQYYTITRTPNGMFIITFTNDFLKQLGAGEHLIKLELDGLDDINTTVTVR